MAAMITDHPKWDELSAYGEGRLAPEAAAVLEAHLAACDGCCKRLADVPGDTFVGLLRDADSAEQREKEQGAKIGRAGATVADATAVPPELVDHARYRVLGLIGQGGMGAVYRAEHRRMDRPVALKVIRPDLMRHQASVERFKQEVRAAARLDHPNIVHAYDADQAGGLHFLVMEYIDGVTLAELVRRRGPLPVAEACEYARQTALGLQHAHERGMVHRDIKPQNLMLQKVGGAVKILDFGLVRLLRAADGPAANAANTGTLTGAGALMGTADYIAPEQADDAGAADIRADIYALGCTLFFLLTGQPPFPRATAAEKIACHAVEPLPPLARVRRDAPAGLTAVLDRMTAKKPARRFPTPARVVTALSPFCPQAAAGPSSGRRRLAAAAILVLAAGLTAGVVITRLGGNPEVVRTPKGNPEPAPELGAVVAPVMEMTEEKAIALIEKLGGKLGRNNGLPDRPVTSVALNDTKVNDEDLRAVAVFKKLQALELRQTPVGDAGMKHLVGLSELRALTLNRTQVTDAGLADIARLGNLRFLSLDETAITGAGLEFLAALHNLENLGLNAVKKVDDEAMTSLARFENLRSIDLRGTHVTDRGLKALADATEFVSLQLDGPGVTDEGVKALAKMSRLAVLDLANAGVTDAGLKEVVTHRRLTNLSLNGCRKVTDAGVRTLTGMPNLDYLSLPATGVTDAGLIGLAERLPHLKHLILWETAVTDAALPELARCPKLSFLCLPGLPQVTAAAVARLRTARPGLFVRHGMPGEINALPPNLSPREEEPMIRNATNLVLFSAAFGLASCQFKVTPGTDTNVPGKEFGASSDPAVNVVQKLGGNPVQDLTLPNKPLVEAYIHGDKVTDAALKELAVCTNLRKLSLNSAKITDDGLKELAALKNLEWLELTSTPITGVGLKDLAGLNKLTYLDLGFSKVNDAGMKSVAALKQLKTLNLISAPITDDGLKEAAALVNLEDLKAGQVRNLGDVGVKALAGLKNLKKLEITNCELGDHGLKSLAGLDQLQHLYVYGTRVSDAGVKAIAGLSHLQELWLSFDVTDEGVSALKGLKELRELKLNGLNNTDACLDDLAQIKSLKKLEVRKDCRISDAGLDKLRAALPNCNILR